MRNSPAFGVITQEEHFGHHSVGKKYSPPLWQKSMKHEGMKR